MSVLPETWYRDGRTRMGCATWSASKNSFPTNIEIVCLNLISPNRTAPYAEETERRSHRSSSTPSRARFRAVMRGVLSASSAPARASARCLMNATASSDYLPATSPVWRGDQVGRVLGRCAPCAAWLLREQLHLCQLPLLWWTHRNAAPTRASRPLPTDLSTLPRPTETRPPPLPFDGHRAQSVVGPDRAPTNWLPLLLQPRSTREPRHSQQRARVITKLLPAHTMHDHGQTSQENGHIGMYARMEAMGDASARAGESG